MTKYYFLATSLPDLSLEAFPEMDFYEFQQVAKDTLSSRDRLQLISLQRYYDMLNIEAYWKKEVLNGYGNWGESELDAALLQGDAIPLYLAEFLDKYPQPEDRQKYFPQLMAAYFNHEIKETSGFLQSYLAFERELRLVMVAFRAKRLGRDLLEALQFENPFDVIVAQIIAQKDSKTYEPPEKYEQLKPIFETHATDPRGLYQALLRYRFFAIEEMVGEGSVFGINRILGYAAQLIMVEQSLQLDGKRGIEIINEIVEAQV